MKSFKKLAVAALISAISIQEVQCGAYSKKYAYLLNGADWVYDNVDSQCAMTNQSPIDLRTDMHSNPFPKNDGTELKKTYQNWKGATVVNKGLVVQVNVVDPDANGASPNNYFESGYAQDSLDAKAKFNAAQFHFHAKSEHTINGKRYGMEMHTVHLVDNIADKKPGDGSIFASALGLMFDPVDYDPTISTSERLIIDKFFDSMNFCAAVGTSNSKYNLNSGVDVPYGDLMGIVNTANRWVYSGSLTTPPCTTGIYFQVVERVLPISKAHYACYLKHQKNYMQTAYFKTDKTVGTAEVTDTPGNNIPVQKTLDVTGNWRITNVVDKHNVQYMRADYATTEDPKVTTIILGVLLGISILVAIILGVCACKQMKEYDAKSQGVDAEGGRQEYQMRETSSKKAIFEKDKSEEQNI